MPMPIKADSAPGARRETALVCINAKCQQSFANMYAYDQHSTHTRNVNTLCASLMMRKEIVATRRAGVTTSVITQIAPKGLPYILAHEWNLMT